MNREAKSYSLTVDGIDMNMTVDKNREEGRALIECLDRLSEKGTLSETVSTVVWYMHELDSIRQYVLSRYLVLDVLKQAGLRRENLLDNAKRLDKYLMTEDELNRQLKEYNKSFEEIAGDKLGELMSNVGSAQIKGGQAFAQAIYELEEFTSQTSFEVPLPEVGDLSDLDLEY